MRVGLIQAVISLLVAAAGSNALSSLTQRRLADPAAVIAGLRADSRPVPTVDHYDQLLRLPERRNPAQPAARAE